MADDIQFTPEESSNPVLPKETASVDFTPDDEATKQYKYGSTGQTALAALEGAGQGLAGPLAPLAEKALGVDPEGITGRAEANPIAHSAGEAAGLIGGAALPVSQAGVLGEAGAAAAKALGFEGLAGTAAKVGVESALYTLGDEVSKTINQDPNSIQTAIMHVGLSGLLGATGGAALGKVSDLWLSKLGEKAEQFAEEFTGRLKEAEGLAPKQEFIQGPFKNFPPKPGTPLFKNVEPEVIPPAIGEKAANKLIDKTVEAASEALSAGAGAVLGKLTGIPGAGYLGAMFGHYSLKPIVSTIMPTLIKPILESPASGVGLKSAIDTVISISKGQSILNQAAKNLFEVGNKSVVNALIPDKDKLDKLDKKIQELKSNPEGMLSIGGELGHYMPSHNAALAEVAQNAVNYISSNKPSSSKPGVLDREIPPNATQEASYRKTLAIAQQPLSVIPKIQDGSLQPKDVQDLKALYPALYSNLVTRTQQAMMEHLSKEGTIPFKTRKGLSTLTGQPMDSTFTQPVILAAQATFPASKPPQQPQGASKAKKGTSALGKSAEAAQTPAEARNKALSKA